MGIDASILAFHPKSVDKEERSSTMGAAIMRCADLADQLVTLEREWRVMTPEQRASLREARTALKRIGRALS